jgi:hypothetical protein
VNESAHPKLFAVPWERRHPGCLPFPFHQARLDAETRNADEQRIKKRWTPISLPATVTAPVGFIPFHPCSSRFLI